MTVTASACLVGHYIKLVNDVSGSNQIVNLIQSAAQRAAINDETVPEKDGVFTRWHVVLQEKFLMIFTVTTLWKPLTTLACQTELLLLRYKHCHTG